jgi:hypothetical protein
MLARTRAPWTADATVRLGAAAKYPESGVSDAP